MVWSSRSSDDRPGSVISTSTGVGFPEPAPKRLNPKLKIGCAKGRMAEEDLLAKERTGPIMLKEEEEDILEVQQPPSTLNEEVPNEQGDLEPKVMDRLKINNKRIVVGR
ncbi:hypothetical protein NDU88_006787 [Pleurodeles waltl]|uniref:Uncharacterized protein n=1 Tax=Pleurodeles waltl TaxID=8319 RepID=A0AAV7N0A0_PLEWA|nr:hypothetical protein NDU88_006787 [Pleurodeles waltl]